MSSSFRYWVRLLGGLAVAVLVFEVFAPSKAQASCGDYVQVGSEQGHGNPDMAPGDQARKPCSQCPKQSGGPGQAPCEGPWCSGNQSPAPLAPTTTIERAQDQVAHLAAFALLNLSGSIPLDGGLDDGARIHHVSDIFHPPRPI